MFAAATAAVATWLAVRPRPRAGRRLRTVVAPPAAGAPAVTRRAAAAIVGTAAVAVLLAGAWPVGVVLAGVAVMSRRRPPDDPVPAGDVPVLAELLAGCLAAGASPAAALQAAASAFGPPMSARCRAVAEALRAGAAPARAWSSWSDDPALAAIARPCLRASTTGAAAAAELTRAAARLRARRRAEVTARLARTGVWVVLPMGLCFLPAFVLVGVVPLVAGFVPALR